MGLVLSEEEMAALERRTEGWVTGLQLAALSLRQQQEVLALQPEPVQHFLVQVAVLTQMNAAACQAVTGERASQAILETLERSNLFVVPLDSERQWYRLHDLFREALLARLQASQPEQAHRSFVAKLLAARAYQWPETLIKRSRETVMSGDTTRKEKE